MKTSIALLIIATVLVAGCRGVALKNCTECTVKVWQGKTITSEVSPGRSIAPVADIAPVVEIEAEVQADGNTIEGVPAP